MFNLEKIFQKNDETYISLIKILSFFVLFGSSYCAFYLRNFTNFYDFLENFGLENNPHQHLFLDSIYYIATLVHLVIYFVLLLFVSKNKKFYKKGLINFFDEYYKLIFFSFLVLALIGIAFKTVETYSRIWFFSYVIITFVISFILKIYFDYKYDDLIKTNRIQRNILLVGDIETCDLIAKSFSKSKNISIIKGIVPTSDDKVKDGMMSNAPLFSLNSDFKKIINYHHIGQIWIVSSAKSFYKVEDLIDKFTMFSIDCRIVTKDSKYEYEKGISSSEGLEFYDISFSKFFGSNLLVKTIMDKIFSLVVLIIFFPMMLFFAILIILEDGFPIFFIQKRTGWDARDFNMIKFRSLKKNQQNKDAQVTRGDTRLLLVGRFIRRFSIDEFPQFINVLKGDMSIVGPRPHPLWLTVHSESAITAFLQRHKCPPGITGWAQVNGLRGPTEDPKLMKKRYEKDLWYLKNWSIMLDLYIMIKTFFVIFTNRVD